MQITPWTIYWITRLDNISTLAGMTIAILMVSALIGVFLWLLARSEYDANLKVVDAIGKRIFRYWAIVFCIAVSVGVFTPNAKEMAAIIVLPAIANNQDFRALGSELPKLAREWIESLRPSEKK